MYQNTCMIKPYSKYTGTKFIYKQTKKDTKIRFNMKIIKIGYKRKETLSP